MKRIKTLSVVLLAAMFLFGSVSVPFTKSAATATVNAAVITISNSSATLEIGTSKSLKISGTASKVYWSSSNKSVATVSSTGSVTAKALGTATITASVSGKKLTSKITVVKPIKISYKTYAIQVGTTKKLYITGTTSKVTWSSSNTKVATVSSWGTITPVAAGTATITAAVAGKKLTCVLTVTEPVKLSNKTYTLQTGNTYKLKITGTTSKITWTSSNQNIATISSYGTITAKAAGKATITAKVDDKTLTCALTVTDPAKISDAAYTLDVSQTYQLKVTGTYTNIVWTTGDASIASVSSTGLVTAAAAGITTITADVDGKKLTCLITVNTPNPYVINAPFAAKEWKSDKYSVVSPSNWSAYFSEASGEGLTASLITFDTKDGSYVSVGIYDTGEAAPDYATAKETFLTELDETMLRQNYSDVFTQLGITNYSITDFQQGDFLSDSGNVFKTEYTLNIMGSATRQIIYYYYIGDKLIEVSATDTNNNLESEVDYIVNSLRLK
jgi:uncharacterized protein YjdB